MTDLPQRDDGRGTADTGDLSLSVAPPVATGVPHLDRAVELLWQSGHPRIGEELHKEVLALWESNVRFQRILYPEPRFQTEPRDAA